MQFDDRLATVLRMRAGSDAVLRTQFRQLLDLLGSRAPAASNGLRAEGYARLGELMAQLPQEDQSRILRQPGLRLRNREIVAFLAAGEAKPAAAAMATARLDEDDWLALIPDLPIAARGFLRHRRDLPARVKRQLAELGVVDMVLPDPGLAPTRPEADLPGEPRQGGSSEGIGALLRRIEAFRETRKSLTAAETETRQPAPLAKFDFATDARGSVVWASDAVAPLAVGLRLAAPRAGELVTRGPRASARLAARQPLAGEPVTIDAAPMLSGDWLCDAVPLFDAITGGFTGYRGRLSRPAPPVAPAANDAGEADAMRQVLHELRTPVGAIQGFAEIIQQQLFGPAPHEYRAHAAAIAVDAAKLLAGFDEVDRMAKLESGAAGLAAGNSDLHEATQDTIRRLQGVLRPRGATLELAAKEGPFLVALERAETLALVWRLLASVAGAMAPGETITVRLDRKAERIRMRMPIPDVLADLEGQDRDPPRRSAVSAGMFGPKFTFRLAQAEARAAGGELRFRKDRVTMYVPALTEADESHSAQEGQAKG
ncbi:histidine kinase dimerization/phospho-acceptor domain-containing protein [Aurantiacibacter luteus]|uniref:histidine kinase n=1 Tax=Aurantiacibacter luteus TaxID=1581420 RepID=A0A0G9MWV8_9SPHN|nr:histidine kinase dimerization/phospho-acceptor domain-containing protein [Aurantiacibacter luteus]KLE35262.1 hypothetical protein AAW00_01980 [Aurantiacibacter luteus]